MNKLIPMLGMMTLLLSLLPSKTLAVQLEYDLAANRRAITFSKSEFYAGDTVRIYGTVTNIGQNDMIGSVTFYRGPEMIGTPLHISAKANGWSEEIWTDWIATEGTYNISMLINSTSPDDQDTSNNQNLTRTFTVITRPEPEPEPEEIIEEPETTQENPTGESSNSGSSSSAPTTAGQPTGLIPSANADEGLSDENTITLADDLIETTIPAENQKNEEENDKLAQANSPTGPNSASITAIVPETPFNTPKKRFNPLEWLGITEWYKNLNPYTKIMGASMIGALIFLILAIFLLKRGKEKQGEKEDKEVHEKKKNSKKETKKEKDEELEDFIESLSDENEK